MKPPSLKYDEDCGSCNICKDPSWKNHPWERLGINDMDSVEFMTKDSSCYVVRGYTQGNHFYVNGDNVCWRINDITRWRPR